MASKLCRCSTRPHTSIMSQAQRGLFGAELGRREGGKRGKMKGITTTELESHLHEAGGKKLPKRVKKRVVGVGVRRRGGRR